MYARGFLKIAAACPAARAGDTAYNVGKMLDLINEAKENKPAIICFPELCISGYSVGDLFYQKHLYRKTLESIDQLLSSNTYEGIIIFGSYIYINDTIFNCSFIAQKKKILGIVPKNFLPHTNEFNEARWFQSGSAVDKSIDFVRLFGYDIPFGKLIFAAGEDEEVKFAAEVCADMWAPISPNELLYANGALIVFNSSASPAYIGKNERRQILTRSISYKFNGVYVYVSNNASESSSEVVFSSHKMIVQNGEIIAEDKKISLASSIIYGDIDISKLHFLRRNNSYYKDIQTKTYTEDVRQVTWELAESACFRFEQDLDILPFVPRTSDDFVEIADIQAAAVIKRLQYVGTSRCVLGLSGGLDSTAALLSLCYGYDKYGFDRKDIITVTMPSAETGSGSLNIARVLAERLGVSFREIPIQELVGLTLRAVGHDGKEKDTTYENIQARIRTNILMNIANREKAVAIGTTDMSETALGFSTFGGDHIAMYGINGGLTKTVIKALVRYYKHIYEDIASVLEDVLTAPISPELTGADQSTECIIGKYEINDFILYRFLICGDPKERIAWLLEVFFKLRPEEATIYVERFFTRFYTQQYKRLSAPESVKILEVSLSPRSAVRLSGDIYEST